MEFNWISDIYTQFHIRIINISVGTRPDLSIHQKLLLLNAARIPLGSWTRRSCLCRQLRTCSRLPAHSSRKQQSYHCWCSRHFSSDPHPKASSQLFRPRSYRWLHCQTWCFCPRHRNCKRQCFLLSISKCSALSFQNRNIHGCSCLFPVQLPVFSSKYPFLTNAEVKLKLHASCVQIPGTESGWGILDFSRLLE